MKDTRTNLKQNKATVYKTCLISVYKKRNALSPYALSQEIANLDQTARWMHSADEAPTNWAKEVATSFYKDAVINDDFTGQFNQDFNDAFNWLIKLRPTLKETT